MLEFVLFHKKPLELFVEFLKAKGIPPQTSEDDGVFEIKIPDDLDEALLEAIEEKYDDLMNMNQALFYEENPPSEENYRMASILIALRSGQATAAHVPPDLLGQILEVISDAELNQFVAAIVDAVENPDERTYC